MKPRPLVDRKRIQFAENDDGEMGLVKTVDGRLYAVIIPPELLADVGYRAAGRMARGLIEGMAAANRAKLAAMSSPSKALH